MTKFCVTYTDIMQEVEKCYFHFYASSCLIHNAV